MNKVQVYEVKAPCKDTSCFEVASGNDNSATASPKANSSSFPAAQQFDESFNEDDRMMDDEDLRCDEIIHEEGSASTAIMESSIS